jgi:hypothetical protein
MLMQVSKYEEALIKHLRTDPWPMFRAVDTALASLPGYNHVPMQPGPLDEESLKLGRSLLHTITH